RPDPGEPAHRPDLCERSARRAPPGPGRHPARRDPRPRDGRDRAPGRAHRAPRLLDAPHQRRSRCAHAPPRHGGRALPHLLFAPRGAGPAARPAGLPSVWAGGTARRRGARGARRRHARRGVIDAESARAAWQALRNRGVFPTELAEERATRRAARRGVAAAELAGATRALATLVAAGVPVTEALAAVGEETEQPALANAFT